MARVAFMTFSVLREAPGHRQVQGFFDRLEANYLAAERSDGMIERSRTLNHRRGETTWGYFPVSRFFDPTKHGGTPRTLSLWEDIESPYAFTYSGLHAEALQSRSAWFLKPEWPSYVLWWVGDDEVPNWDEAKERHEHLHDNGPSTYAFNFRTIFDVEGESSALDRELVKLKIERNTNVQREL